MDEVALLSLLAVPCAVSAVDFYLLFKDYEWESDKYHSLNVQLINREFDRQLCIPRSNNNALFFNPSEVTPMNVSEHF